MKQGAERWWREEKTGAAARLGRAGGKGAGAGATIVPRPSSSSSSVLAETLVPLHRLPVTLSVEDKCGIIYPNRHETVFVHRVFSHEKCADSAIFSRMSE